MTSTEFDAPVCLEEHPGYLFLKEQIFERELMEIAEETWKERNII